MKINRFIALSAIALLVVGVMGIMTYRAYAQGSSTPPAQSQDCTIQDDDTVKIAGPDTDDVELECGEQDAVDTEDGAEVLGPYTDNVEEQIGEQSGADTEETIGGADTDNVQLEEQVDDQGTPDTGVEMPEVDAPSVP